MEKVKWGPSPIRFENVWLKHKSFKSSFLSWWNNTNVQGWEGYKFMRKLKDIKCEIEDGIRSIWVCGSEVV